jgi:hypothetical protein
MIRPSPDRPERLEPFPLAVRGHRTTTDDRCREMQKIEHGKVCQRQIKAESAIYLAWSGGSTCGQERSLMTVSDPLRPLAAGAHMIDPVG